MPDDKLIVCRCEEVTLDEIKKAVKDGASTVSGIKKRTRACMGMCQGRVCQSLVKKVLAHESGNQADSIETATSRSPVRPIQLGEII
ncbi:MAG: (2Fe-2S)-binding protein [Peptococcaceae bacterium BICA1-7]|nr:MAG: (2Fe-2S)-binding protein [Peptococcaceae bacterium BICA1-7]HBV96766.1 (2Fe-2S)-binding protein [Desulfotomaculum sp.]